MIYAYVRVSTDKQTTENQRYEILNFADSKHLKINDWVHETISSSKRLQERTLFALLTKLQPGDTLIVSELSRLGRSLMEVMSMLHHLMDKQVNVLAVKEGYELGNNLNSKVLAFAFSLSAEVERTMIASRTKEALARKKQAGQRLGRPKGSLSKTTKLSGKETDIQTLLAKRVSISAIARILGVSRMTVSHYIKSRRLKAPLSA